MIIWISDPHLNFLHASAITTYGKQIAAENPEAVLISGDIAEYENFDAALFLLVKKLKCPTYFVLGNHDIYGGFHEQAQNKARKIKFSKYLTHQSFIELTPKIALIGNDGWYDGRNGNYMDSRVDILDFTAIKDLKFLSKIQRLELFQKWTDDAAVELRETLDKALKAGYDEVFCITHVPPCKEAGWHNGKLQNDEWAPFFSNAVVGPSLVEVAKNYPDQHVTILAGHTHSSGYHKPSFNVEIFTGAAEYRETSYVKIPI
jgi:3',5'-cyclic-AMP phosphodiesterase